MCSHICCVYLTGPADSAEVFVFIVSDYNIYGAISMHIKRRYYLLLSSLSDAVCLTPLYKQVHTRINHCSYHHYCANGLNQSPPPVEVPLPNVTTTAAQNVFYSSHSERLELPAQTRSQIIFFYVLRF
jgi:hypothetical protein